MKKVIIILVLILALSVVLVFMLRGNGPMEDTFTDLGDIDAPDGDGVPQDGAPSVGGTIILQTDAGPVEVNDIRALEEAYEMGEGRYEVSGSPKDEFFPDFNIVYAARNGSFSISLNTEPLAETRVQAENRLQSILGISQVDMCQLKIFLGVPFDVNPEISGMNLGFSFCPGSVQLQ